MISIHSYTSTIGLCCHAISSHKLHLLGQVCANFFHSRSLYTIAVGGVLKIDATLKETFIFGLVQNGIDIFDVGNAPKPALYFASSGFGYDAACLLERNDGILHISIRLHHRNLTIKEYEDIVDALQTIEYQQGSLTYQQEDIFSVYLATLAKNNIPTLDRPIAIIEANEAVQQFAKTLPVPSLLLPAKQHQTFPAIFKKHKVLFGVHINNIGTQIRLFDASGRKLLAEQTMVRLMKLALQWKKAAIVWGGETPAFLKSQAEKQGVSLIETSSSQSEIQRVMRESNAILSGTPQGEFCYRDGHYSFADAFFVVTKLLQATFNVAVFEPQSEQS